VLVVEKLFRQLVTPIPAQEVQERAKKQQQEPDPGYNQVVGDGQEPVDHQHTDQSGRFTYYCG
jgi:hypothetical protein